MTLSSRSEGVTVNGEVRISFGTDHFLDSGVVTRPSKGASINDACTRGGGLGVADKQTKYGKLVREFA